MVHLGRVLACLLLAGYLSSCGGGGAQPATRPASIVTANAGPDAAATEANTVQLAGGGSDSDGSTVMFLWTQLGGPTVALSASDTPNPTFVAPDSSVGDSAKIVLRLTVSNVQSTQAQDDVTVTVRASDFLVFRATNDSLDAAKLYKYDVALDTTMTLSGPMVANGGVHEFKISPDGRYVAYRADQDTAGMPELYVASSDGSGRQKVSGGMTANAGSGGYTIFEWAPSGDSLFFYSGSEIYVVNPDGSGLYKVSDSPSYSGVVHQPRWSPNSRYIAYTLNAPQQPIRLYVHDMAAPGSADTNISADLGPTDGINSAQWSPDSRHLAYLFASALNQTGPAIQSLMISSLDGTPTLSLSDRAWFPWHWWSPDNNFIVFEEDLDHDNTGDLYVAIPDGSSRVLLNSLPDSRGWLGYFNWAPDSSQVAFTVREDGTSPYRLYVSSRDGSAISRVSHHSSATSDTDRFGWSPDGSRIAFRESSGLNGAYSAFVAMANGSGVYEVSEPPQDAIGVTFGIRDQLWSPDGSYLAWRSAIDSSGINGIYVSDIQNLVTNLVTPLPPQVAGQLQSLGRWSSDSSALAYTSQQDSAAETELYISNSGGSMNIRVSGSMGPNVRVADDFSWSP